MHTKVYNDLYKTLQKYKKNELNLNNLKDVEYNNDIDEYIAKQKYLSKKFFAPKKLTYN